MKRQLMTQLQAWKEKTNRKPLILKGVRQTGKTYLLEQFGHKYFESYHIINFERQEQACGIFEKDLEPKRILEELKFFFNKSININQDLVIFDEIQACPKAITSLKYFCEEMPTLALCSAGSLLGLQLNESAFPVGKVDMLHLFPMTFSEFLSGIDDKKAEAYLFEINCKTTISDLVHQHLWERLKQYFITGGLPEVISTFASYQENMYDATKMVRQKQNELIKAYYADIAKHSGKINAMHIDRTWRSVAAQLSKTQNSSTNRFKFKGIIPNINRYAQLVNVIDWLAAAELIIKLPLIDKVQQPLLAYTKENFFKLMMFDIGILGAMIGLDPKIILDYDYGTYKGYFAENFVAQQLQASLNIPLFSWEYNRSEIEFLITDQGMVIPIEVKSGKITRAQSLQKYIEIYKPTNSFILSAKKLNINKPLIQLPLYLTERIRAFY